MDKFAIYGFVVLILTAGAAVPSYAQEGSSDRSPDNRMVLPQYVILKLSDDTLSPVIGHGQIASRVVFEDFFNSYYTIFGQRWAPANNSKIVGLLVVFDAETSFKLPIYGWEEGNGAMMFLCRGTSSDGAPPRYLARSNSMQELFKKIKTDLENKEFGKDIELIPSKVKTNKEVRKRRQGQKKVP